MVVVVIVVMIIVIIVGTVSMTMRAAAVRMSMVALWNRFDGICWRSRLLSAGSGGRLVSAGSGCRLVDALGMTVTLRLRLGSELGLIVRVAMIIVRVPIMRVVIIVRVVMIIV